LLFVSLGFYFFNFKNIDMLDNSLIPALNINTGSATNLAMGSEPQIPGQPNLNQPPAWTRPQSNEVPVMPQVISPPQRNFGMPTTPAITGLPWTRETQLVPLPMNQGAVHIDMPEYPPMQQMQLPQGQSFQSSPNAVGGLLQPRQEAGVEQVRHTGVVMDARTPEHVLINSYFAQFMNDNNYQQIHAIVQDRLQWFQQRGETAPQIELNMQRANDFDLGFAAVNGAVNAVPFAAAASYLHAVPGTLSAAKGNPAGEGALAGVFSGSADFVGTELLKPATSNTNYLKADVSMLEPALQEVVAAQTPGLGARAVKGAASLLPYTARNVIGAATTVGGMASAAAPINIFGGIAAGAGSGVISRYFDQRHQMDGPGFLLGRKDWQDRYLQLASATWKEHGLNGLERAGKFPGDVVTNLSNALGKLVTPSGIAEMAELGAGFATVSALENAAKNAATAAGYGEVGRTLAGEATKTAASLVVYSGLVPSMLAAESAANAATEAIQRHGFSNTALPSPGNASPATTAPHVTLELGDPDLVVPPTARQGRAPGAGSAEDIELSTALLNSPSRRV
jgi:hypothetical protein